MFQTRESKPIDAWVPIQECELSNWNSRLLKTNSHYRQYPYWCEAHRENSYLTPRYFKYTDGSNDLAYIAILEGVVASIKFGLVFRGPVKLSDRVQSVQLIDDLQRICKERNYVFLRITHNCREDVHHLSSLENARQVESFPFYRDPPKSLIIKQNESDQETLGTFQSIARREIKQAKERAFDICTSDLIEDYERVWPMFENLADRKGFLLSSHSRDFWSAVVQGARRAGLSKLYTAIHRDRCVGAVHLLRYGRTAEFMLGALDVAALGKNPSPSGLIHWKAMRDFYRQGCDLYNLGGPGDGVKNKVFQFKRKFRPTLVTAEPPVTLIYDFARYRCWNLLVLNGWMGVRRQAERIYSKSLDLGGALLARSGRK
jgi:hypothetical protein